MSTISPPRLDGSSPLDVPESSTPPPERRRSRVERLWRGPEADPAWARPALLALLAITAAPHVTSPAAFASISASTLGNPRLERRYLATSAGVMPIALSSCRSSRERLLYPAAAIPRM